MTASTATSIGREAASFHRDRRTWAAYLIVGLFCFLETSLGPAVPFLREQFDLSYTIASLHFSAFAVGGILIGVLGERIVGAIGRQWAIWGGLLGTALGGAMLGLMPSVYGTIGGALLMGIAGALCLVTQQATLSDIHGNLRTIAFTESNVVATAAAVLAPLAIGGFAATRFGWETGVVITVPAMLVLYAVYRSIRFPEAPVVAHDHPSGTRLPGIYWLFWAVLFLVSAVEWCMAFWGAEYLASVVGLSNAAAATVMSIYFAAMMVGRFIGSRLARRARSTLLLQAAIVVAIGGFPIFWLVDTPVIAIAGLFIAGLGIANFYPLSVSAATDTAPHLAVRATARLAISGAIALITAPFVLGAISDAFGMRGGFTIVIPILIVALVATGYAHRHLSRA